MSAAASSLTMQRQADLLNATPGGAVMGRSMKVLAVKKRAEIARLKMSGAAKPYTVINLIPWDLYVETPGIVNYRIPGRKAGEPYSAFTIETPTFCYPYRGFKSDGQNSIIDYDVMTILPAQQAMEFFANYMINPQDMKGLPMGGVFIFEGDLSVLEKAKPETVVQTPTLNYLEDGSVFIGTEPRKLTELRDEALAKLQAFTMATLHEAKYFSSDPRQTKNITHVHRRYEKLAFEMGWINAHPSWIEAGSTPENVCPRCRKEVHPDQYMCGGCGKIFDALEAYRQGDIEYGHVSFEKLDAAGWKEAKKIKAQRDKAKGEDEKA